jgi:hypothetical protein
MPGYTQAPDVGSITDIAGRFGETPGQPSRFSGVTDLFASGSNQGQGQSVIGQPVGTAVGAGAGALIGSFLLPGAAGAKAGAAIGSVIGNVIDFFISKSAQSKQVAEDKRVENVRMRYFLKAEEADRQEGLENKRIGERNFAETKRLNDRTFSENKRLNDRNFKTMEEEKYYDRRLKRTSDIMNLFAQKPSLSTRMTNLWRTRGTLNAV